MDERLSGRPMQIGVASGLAAVAMYLAGALLSLPTFLSRPFWVLMGPFMSTAFVGIFPFLVRQRMTASAVLGTVLGVLAGALRCVFSVVQSNNLFYVRRYMAAESSDAAREEWRHILNGVFTVQNGINYAYDLFLDLAILFLALALWRHPRPGKILAVAGIALAAVHFALKLIAFPEPPAEAGLFDVGPAVGLWFLALLVWMVVERRWAERA